MGLEEKTISSSGCTSGSAELVSDPNNILFSNHTYHFSNVSPFNIAQRSKKTYRWDAGPIQGCRNREEVPKTAGGETMNAGFM